MSIIGKEWDETVEMARRILAERQLIAAAAPRCTHPNLFGCKGHCVWCGEQVGALRLVVDNTKPVQP